MKTTARFEIQRRQQLKKLFSIKNLEEIWRKRVRNQLRQLDVRDLHDYYDFHASLDSHIRAIIVDIQSGNYRSDPPLIYRLEKKLGVCRHVLIPSPADALVFQVLTESLDVELTKKQPSSNAYYSRNRHSVEMPH